MTADEAAFFQGRVLSGYRVGDYINSGGFGMVFEATHETSGQRSAIKIQASGDLTEFRNEAVLLRKLRPYSHVINFVDGGREEIRMQVPGMPGSLPIEINYHLLQLAEGSIEDLVRDPVVRNERPWDEKLGLWRDVVYGVRQMHAAGIAHRDLKSGNCLIVSAGKTVGAKLADLGRSRDLTLASSLSPETYWTGRGDRRHAPPEFLWLQGGAQPSDFVQADYYGLASVLTEIAVGLPLSLLALGDFRSVLLDAQSNLRAGVYRDLSVLQPQYARVCAEVAQVFPSPIQEEARALLALLSQPVPAKRLIFPGLERARDPRDPLAFVLRRTDIMRKRLAVDRREARRLSNRSKKVNV
jgi:serine/threonine protein kinase